VSDNGSLRLLLPRLKFFFVHNGEEIEVVPGMIVDGAQEGTTIFPRHDIRERIFAAGKQIQFDAFEFHEIACASFLFAHDLRAKLPTKP